MIHPLALLDAFQNCRLLVRMIRRDEERNRFANRFRRGVTKNPLGPRVPGVDPPIEADAQDPIGRRFYDGGQPSSRFVGAFPLEKLPKLTANSRQHLKKIFVGHADLPAEAFNNAKNLISEPDRETNCRMKSCLNGRRSPREI